MFGITPENSALDELEPDDELGICRDLLYDDDDDRGGSGREHDEGAGPEGSEGRQQAAGPSSSGGTHRSVGSSRAQALAGQHTGFSRGMLVSVHQRCSSSIPEA